MNETYIFDWLTYSWLIENMWWLSIGMVASIVILFLFPLLLGYDLKKNEDKKKKQKSRTLTLS